MKVLWISNYPLPSISEAAGLKKIHNEGWKCKLAEQIEKDDAISAFCVAFASAGASNYCGRVGNIEYVSFEAGSSVTCSRKNQTLFAELFRRFSPDIIHIWGTEFPHTLDALYAAKTCGLQNNTVISLQGIMRACADDYDKFLPKKACRCMIGDRLLKRGVKKEKKEFSRRAEYESEALKATLHVIGRTDFDHSYALNINPSLHYHFCGETMREEFYNDSWSYDACEKHTLFMSQATYPIKGLHLVLPMLALLKKKYPQVQLRIAGGDILSPPQGRFKLLKRYAYPSYLRDLIRQYKLANNISVLGPLNAEQMREEFLRSHCFLSGSVVENSPNSVCEALLLGVPTVASNVGGTADVLTHKEEGFLYECDRAEMGAFYVDRIFSDRETAEKISKNARSAAHIRHNQNNNYNTLKSIYKDIIESGETMK